MENKGSVAVSLNHPVLELSRCRETPRLPTSRADRHTSADASTANLPEKLNRRKMHSIDGPARLVAVRLVETCREPNLCCDNRLTVDIVSTSHVPATGSDMGQEWDRAIVLAACEFALDHAATAEQHSA